jgi:hypothetical protein
MLEECRLYPVLVADTCVAAVMVAYWYHSENCEPQGSSGGSW